MRIKVKLFALYREKAGTSELWLELPEGASVRQALDKLREEAPALQEVLSRALLPSTSAMSSLKIGFKKAMNLPSFRP